MSHILHAARKGINSPVRSALGISKIADVQVSQVLHATPADTALLRDHLSRWGISSFDSFPLLLRALTHTSVSNWAEQALRLPKRSLSPATLELLGDRVVGVAVAQAVLNWLRTAAPSSPPSSAADSERVARLQWHGGPRAVVASLVGNRGMADAATRMQLPSLLRWEKALPPEPHRARLAADGVDVTTGMQSTLEVNALAAAYEAVAAAVYLDGGYAASRAFVDATLLSIDPVALQTANRDVRDHEDALRRELPAVFAAPVAFFPAYNGATPTTQERAVLQILDLDPDSLTDPPTAAAAAAAAAEPDHVHVTHTVFYSAVALRPVADFHKPVREEDLLSLCSHFSVTTARVAAIEAAMGALRGERASRKMRSERGAALTRERLKLRGFATPSASSASSTPAPFADGGAEDAAQQQARHEGSAAESGAINMAHVRGRRRGPPPLGRDRLVGTFDMHGRWVRDGDYAHTGRVLAHAGMPGLDGANGAAEVQARLFALREKREADEAALHAELESRASTRYGCGAGADAQHEGRKRRRWPGEGVGEEVEEVEEGICEETISHCLAIGHERLATNELGQTHRGARGISIGTGTGTDGQDAAGKTEEAAAAELAQAIRDGVRAANTHAAGNRGRRRELSGLNSLGHQTMRLWATQSSVLRVSQDRAALMGAVERRAGLIDALAPHMLGGDGALRGVRDVRGRSGYMAVGAVVDRVGVETALAWLGGAEILATAHANSVRTRKKQPESTE